MDGVGCSGTGSEVPGCSWVGGCCRRDVVHTSLHTCGVAFHVPWFMNGISTYESGVMNGISTYGSGWMNEPMMCRYM